VSKKAWIIFAVIVVGLLAALVISSRNANPPVDVSNVNPNSLQAATAQNGNIADHTFGETNSKVTLIEYGDFECPYCGQAHPQIKAISQQYASQITFVFRNFPITQIHPNAKAAAATVEAAGLQGKYWEMHNLIYESQSTWQDLTGSDRDNQFLAYAKQLGLDTAKFTTDVASSAVLKKISFDEAIANKIGVSATPTFYLDGTVVSSDVVQDAQSGNGDKLRALLNTELQKAGIALPASS
jgi:protein-disulfide isomerase